jgi:putative transposase
MTVFADMTIGEVLQLMAEYRREDPAATEIYHDRLMQAKIRRFDEISSIGVEHDLPRSYNTFEECKAMAKAVFAGARVIRTETLPGTTAPNAITSLAPGAGVFQIGGGNSVIDGVVIDDPEETAEDTTDPTGDPTVSGGQLPSTPSVETTAPQKRTEKAPSKVEKLVRPKNLKELK